MIFLAFNGNYFKDFEKIRNELSYKNPYLEFLDFEQKYKDSDLLLSNNSYILVYDNNLRKIITTQFYIMPLNDLFAQYKMKINNRLKTTLEKQNDSIEIKNPFLKKIQVKQLSETLFQSKFTLFEHELLSANTLKLYREKFNLRFYHDLKLTDSLQKHARFNGNKQLFKQFHNLLSNYAEMYTKEENIVKVINLLENDKFEKIYVNDGKILLLVKLKANNSNVRAIKNSEKEIIKRYKRAIKHFEMSTFCSRYFYLLPNSIDYHTNESLKKRLIKEGFILK